MPSNWVSQRETTGNMSWRNHLSFLLGGICNNAFCWWLRAGLILQIEPAERNLISPCFQEGASLIWWFTFWSLSDAAVWLNWISPVKTTPSVHKWKTLAIEMETIKSAPNETFHLGAGLAPSARTKNRGERHRWEWERGSWKEVCLLMAVWRLQCQVTYRKEVVVLSFSFALTLLVIPLSFFSPFLRRTGFVLPSCSLNYS